MGGAVIVLGPIVRVPEEGSTPPVAVAFSICINPYAVSMVSRSAR